MKIRTQYVLTGSIGLVRMPVESVFIVRDAPFNEFVFCYFEGENSSRKLGQTNIERT